MLDDVIRKTETHIRAITKEPENPDKYINYAYFYRENIADSDASHHIYDSAANVAKKGVKVLAKTLAEAKPGTPYYERTEKALQLFKAFNGDFSGSINTGLRRLRKYSKEL